MMSQERAVLKRFVVLEGVDGAGTTTQLRRLGQVFARRGIPASTGFEPTDLPTGKLVRRLLKGEVEARPETLARLFAADRNEHLYGRGGVIECLDRGELVLLDRYLFSSLAYQGVACGYELPRALNAGFPLPELLIYFDVEPSVSMARVKHRSELEIFEELSIQERVRAAYEEVLAEFEGTPMRILRIDAALPVEEVGAAVDEAMELVLRSGHT